MVAQALVAALILFTYNWLAVGLGVASLGLVAIYPFAKRFTWWPQVFLGLAFNWGAVLVFTAHQGRIGGASLALYGAGIAWTLYYDTIYAHQDKDDDALIGVKSTARLFGDNSRVWLWGFIVATLALMVLAILLAQAAGLALGVALLGVAAFGLHMMRQMRRLDMDDAGSCLREFRSNRDAGLLAALFLAVAAAV
jgi:4-hydroxybenzoate polyprenyltransferase